MPLYLSRTWYLNRPYGLVQVRAAVPMSWDRMLGENNWMAWAGYIRGLQRLGEKADKRLA